jgi:hypothetical protein
MMCGAGAGRGRSLVMGEGGRRGMVMMMMMVSDVVDNGAMRMIVDHICTIVVVGGMRRQQRTITIFHQTITRHDRNTLLRQQSGNTTGKVVQTDGHTGSLIKERNNENTPKNERKK